MLDRVRSHVPYPMRLRLARVQRVVRDLDRSASLAARRLALEIPELVLLCVYRLRNTSLVEGLRRQAGPTATLLLWGLDGTAPELAEWTVGHGPGLRVELLNRLHAHVPTDFAGWIVLADDDVVVSMGTLDEAAALARRAGFGLCQPAHDRHSHRSHRINEAQALSLARHTTFVEVGPVVLVSPNWRARVLPMPDGYGMGPGLESEWMRLADEGCRLGVIDAVRIAHVGVPGAAYDLDGSVSGFRSDIEARGGRRAVLRSLATWRVWTTVPPW